MKFDEDKGYVKEDTEELVANCYFCPPESRNKTDRMCNFVGLPNEWQRPVCLSCTKLMKERKHPSTGNRVKEVVFKLSH